MRWNLPHREGEMRTRARFAFLPTKLDDGSKVWLERYWVRERLAIGLQDDEQPVDMPCWEWRLVARGPWWNRPTEEL